MNLAERADVLASTAMEKQAGRLEKLVTDLKSALGQVPLRSVATGAGLGAAGGALGAYAATEDPEKLRRNMLLSALAGAGTGGGAGWWLNSLANSGGGVAPDSGRSSGSGASAAGEGAQASVTPKSEFTDTPVTLDSQSADSAAERAAKQVAWSAGLGAGGGAAGYGAGHLAGGIADEMRDPALSRQLSVMRSGEAMGKALINKNGLSALERLGIDPEDFARAVRQDRPLFSTGFEQGQMAYGRRTAEGRARRAIGSILADRHRAAGRTYGAEAGVRGRGSQIMRGALENDFINNLERNPMAAGLALEENPLLERYRTVGREVLENASPSRNPGASTSEMAAAADALDQRAVRAADRRAYNAAVDLAAQEVADRAGRSAGKSMAGVAGGLEAAKSSRPVLRRLGLGLGTFGGLIGSTLGAPNLSLEGIQ